MKITAHVTIPVVHPAQASCFYDLALPDSDEELDDDAAAAFAGSEASGLSGAAPGGSDVFAASDAADAGVASRLRDGSTVDAACRAQAGSKRLRQTAETAEESPSEGSTGAAERKLACGRGGVVMVPTAEEAVQQPNADSEDQCMSTPEAPAAALPAASVVSDARDSFAGNALAALAAADAATAESQLTPVLSQAAAQLQPVEEGSLPRPFGAAEEAQIAPSSVHGAAMQNGKTDAGEPLPVLLVSAPATCNGKPADAVQTVGEGGACAVPAGRKTRGPALGSVAPLTHRKPWK